MSFVKIVVVNSIIIFIVIHGYFGIILCILFSILLWCLLDVLVGFNSGMGFRCLGCRLCRRRFILGVRVRVRSSML